MKIRLTILIIVLCFGIISTVKAQRNRTNRDSLTYLIERDFLLGNKELEIKSSDIVFLKYEKQTQQFSLLGDYDSLCIRLFKTVLNDKRLVTLLQKENDMKIIVPIHVLKIEDDLFINNLTYSLNTMKNLFSVIEKLQGYSIYKPISIFVYPNKRTYD